MTNKKTTLRALLLSLISVLACVAMLVGSTFAWFTDSVSSMNNIIKSGNLDMVVEYKTNWADSWAELEADDKLFGEDNLYEPGYTKVVFLRVSNAGSLALKYKLAANIVSEKASTNVYGEEFKLSDYLQIGVYTQAEYSSGANYADILMPIMFGTREAARNSVAANSIKLADFGGVAANDVAVLPGDDTAQVMALVLYMPEEVGNEANHKTGVAAPEITFGLNVLATQMMHEDDSFGPDYDEDAEYPTAINTTADLAAALAAGGEVVLTSDIVLDSSVTIPAGVETVLNLNGHTISQSYAATASYQMISNKGSLTIKGDGKISFTDTGAGDTGTSWASYTIRNEGTLVVDGGTIEHLGQQDGNMNNAIFSYSGDVTINGGVINCPYSRSVRLWKGNLTINGGTFDGQVWVQPADATCVLTINGGSFKPATNGNDGSSVYVTNSAARPVVVSVTGGDFATKFGCADAAALAGCITGGNFTADAQANTNPVLFA